LRNKWKKIERNLEIGDIVLVKDENVGRNEWNLARVKECMPSVDGHVRKVKLQLAHTELDRPVHKLVLLVGNEGDSTDEEP